MSPPVVRIVLEQSQKTLAALSDLPLLDQELSLVQECLDDVGIVLLFFLGRVKFPVLLQDLTCLYLVARAAQCVAQVEIDAGEGSFHLRSIAQVVDGVVVLAE